MEADNKSVRRERITIGLAIVATFIATASVIVSQRQWQVMREQTADARKAMQLEHRAWLLAKDIGFVGTVAAGQPFTLHLGGANLGRTPGRNVTFGGIITTASQEIVAPRVMVFMNEQRDIGMSIGRDDTWNINLANPTVITTEQMAAILAGRETIRLTGEIIYRDVFDQLRGTRICYETRPVPNGIGFVACTGHNDDEDMTHVPEPKAEPAQAVTPPTIVGRPN